MEPLDQTIRLCDTCLDLMRRVSGVDFEILTIGFIGGQECEICGMLVDPESIQAIRRRSLVVALQVAAELVPHEDTN